MPLPQTPVRHVPVQEGVELGTVIEIDPMVQLMQDQIGKVLIPQACATQGEIEVALPRAARPDPVAVPDGDPPDGQSKFPAPPGHKRDNPISGGIVEIALDPSGYLIPGTWLHKELPLEHVWLSRLLVKGQPDAFAREGELHTGLPARFGLFHLLELRQRQKDEPLHLELRGVVGSAGVQGTVYIVAEHDPAGSTTIGKRVSVLLYFAGGFHYLGGMILHLFQQIPYKQLSLPGDSLEACWQAALEKADTMETGCELCLETQPDLSVTRYGWADAPDEDDKNRIAEGIADKQKPHDFAIEPGRWRFEQLEYLPDRDEIRREMNPYVAERSAGPLYIRIIKENALELAVQLLWLPSEG